MEAAIMRVEIKVVLKNTGLRIQKAEGIVPLQGDLFGSDLDLCRLRLSLLALLGQED